jgi:hypothetical protein
MLHDSTIGIPRGYIKMLQVEEVLSRVQLQNKGAKFTSFGLEEENLASFFIGDEEVFYIRGGEDFRLLV